MFSFRVSDRRIARLLAAMPDRSDFIRQAVTEKLWAGQDDDDTHTPPDVIAPDAAHAAMGHVQRLQDGLMAIANGSAAILDAGGENVPDIVQVGLTGIGEAAAILAAGEPSREKAVGLPQDRLTPEPVADVTIVGFSELGIEVLSALDPEMAPESGVADVGPDTGTDDSVTFGYADPARDTAAGTAMFETGEPELPFGTSDADPVSTHNQNNPTRPNQEDSK